MKVKVHVKYPSIITIEDDVEVVIPDGEEDIENWIYEHKEDILDKAGCEYTEDALSNAFDLGYADVVLIKDGEK